MSGPEGRVVGLGGGRLLIAGVLMSVLGGGLLLWFFGIDSHHSDTIEQVLALVVGTPLLGYGAVAVHGGVSRIRSARVLRRRPGFLWAAQCCEVERPEPIRLFVIEHGGVCLLSQRGEHVRSWAWAELGGAKVERLSAVQREWNALVLWSRDERRLAQIGFPEKELVLAEGAGFSVDDPDDPRAVILDQLRRNQRSSEV